MSESDESTGTIEEKLASLRKMFPKRDGLHLHRVKADRIKPTKAATLYVYIRSSDNTYALHETLFRRKQARTPLEWQHYMRTEVVEGAGSESDNAVQALGVLRGAIIPGVNLRSGKQWDIRAVIGFTTHDIHRAVSTAIRAKRNKAKSQRRSHGQTDIRRRHGNSKRQAK